MPPETALEAFERYRTEALRGLDLIRASLDATRSYSPERIDWAQAGTMAHVVSLLGDVNEMIP